MTATEVERLGASLLIGIPDEPRAAHRWAMDKVAVLDDALYSFKTAERAEPDPKRREALRAQLVAAEWSRAYLVEHSMRLLHEIEPVPGDDDMLAVARNQRRSVERNARAFVLEPRHTGARASAARLHASQRRFARPRGSKRLAARAARRGGDSGDGSDSSGLDSDPELPGAGRVFRRARAPPRSRSSPVTASARSGGGPTRNFERKRARIMSDFETEYIDPEGYCESCGLDLDEDPLGDHDEHHRLCWRCWRGEDDADREDDAGAAA